MGTAASAADAIAGGNGGNVQLGRNWFPYETYAGRAFRWVDNDAEITVRGNGLVRVSIACEGGPSLGALTFPLRALDASGRQVDHVVCAGPGKPMVLLVPVRGETHLTLHVDGGGKPVPHDARILNFRVFSLDAGGVARGDDIAVAPVRLGDHWYPIERFRGQTFRWLNGNDAQFIVPSDRNRSAQVRLLVAPGPSIGAGQAAVTIRDGAGKTLSSTTVRGVQALLLPVTLQRGDNVYTIHVDHSKEARVPGDSRLLDLRAFSIAVR